MGGWGGVGFFGIKVNDLLHDQSVGTHGVSKDYVLLISYNNGNGE